MTQMEKAYRALVSGDGSAEFPTAEEALRHASSRLYLSLPRQEALERIRADGLLEWSYGFKSAEVREVSRA